MIDALRQRLSAALPPPGRAELHGAPLLEVRGLTVSHGLVEAVTDLGIIVPRGSIITIIGPNGAGKTTTMEALIGLVPCRGEVIYNGANIAVESIGERVDRGIALVPESRDLFSDMTVRENLLLGAYRRYRRGKRRFEGDLDRIFRIFPRLDERQRQVAGTLSGGERQMLAIGRAMMGAPSLLLLDEPSLGLAPLMVAEIFKIIRRLREAGISILLVEQNARAALALADYGYVLETGRVVTHGRAEVLADDPRLVEAYLGFA
jgi:branched-chain amino acid transport system ATP-binding protein